MSEKSARPATADNIGWNTTPTNPSTDPGGAVRAAGWAKDAIPGSDEFNYLQTMWGDFLQWLESTNAREWLDVSEGIAATSTFRDLFRVIPLTSLGAISDRYYELFNIANTGASGNPSHLCTDGEQMYYISGALDQYLIAASPLAGTEIFDVDTGIQIMSICCDGQAVYANTYSNSGLYVYDRDTGAYSTKGGTEYACTALRTNGEYCVGIRPNSSTSKIVFWTVATPTETGTVTITPLNGVAIDADQCYVGGTRATYDVWAYTLSSRAVAWQVTLATSSAPTVNAIAADGDFVYVCTDRVALTAGGNANLFCLSRYDGATLWTMDVGSTVNLDYCAVDDKYLHVTDDADLTYMIKLGAPVPHVVATVADLIVQCCDGIGVGMLDAATAANFARHHVGHPTKTFMRAAADDPNRRPFHTLAVPV